MRALLSGTAAAVVGSAAIVALSATPAFGAVTNGNETFNVSNPYSVINSSAGVPAVGAPTGQGVLTGSGFVPGQGEYLEICDGVSPTSVTWNPTIDCSNANGVTAAKVNGSNLGSLSINTATNPFSIFHGEEPNDLFNCLAPGDNPNSTTTAVGNQTIDPNVPSWGSSMGAGHGGGGTAACQLRLFSSSNQAYLPTDIFVPITNLDGAAATPPSNTPESPIAIVLPVAAVALLGAGGTIAVRRRRRHQAA